MKRERVKITVENQQYVTTDSGERQQFETGAQRDTRTGKGRYDLLSVVAIRREAELLERGAIKYGDRNWEKGMPVSRFIDSAIRHLFRYLEGECTEDHLASARWNIGCAMQMEELRPELQDVPTRPAALPKSGAAA